MKNLYFVFADIRGFTMWSEKNTSEKVQSMLKEFYKNMGGNYIHANITIDEILLFFEDLNSALEFSLKLRKFAEKLYKKYGLSLGISIHKGQVDEMYYNNGQIEYKTYVGHPICVGKRLESLGYGGDIVISDDIFREFDKDNQGLFSVARDIYVKGKTKKIKIHFSFT